MKHRDRDICSKEKRVASSSNYDWLTPQSNFLYCPSDPTSLLSTPLSLPLYTSLAPQSQKVRTPLSFEPQCFAMVSFNFKDQLLTNVLCDWEPIHLKPFYWHLAFHNIWPRFNSRNCQHQQARDFLGTKPDQNSGSCSTFAPKRPPARPQAPSLLLLPAPEFALEDVGLLLPLEVPVLLVKPLIPLSWKYKYYLYK